MLELRGGFSTLVLLFETAFVAGSSKMYQISSLSKIDFMVYFGRRICLKQDTLVLQT